MSVWGAGLADNDDAADWLAEFEEEPSIPALNDAFDEVLSSSAEDYLEVTECAAALAAAQIVAEVFSEPGSDSLLEDEEILLDLQSSAEKMHPSARLNLVERAMNALGVVAYGTSELQEMMREDKKLWRQWIKDVQALEGRLKSWKNYFQTKQ